MTDESRYDDLLMTMAGQLGSIDGLLRTLFSFLHRKTDFYVEWDPALLASERPTMGFASGKAEELLLQAFHAYPFKDYRTARAASAGAPSRKQPQQKREPSSANSQQVKAAAASKLAGEAASRNQKARPAQPVHSREQPDTPAALRPEEQVGESTTDGGGVTAQQSQQPGTKQTPVGNGGACPDHGYCWTQTLQEVTVYVDVPKGTRGRDMVCDIGTRSLSCKLKGAGGQQLLTGQLPASVKRDGSLWNLDSDDGVLVVTLEKVAKTWWACALEAHPEIDTSKVDSTCKVGDYDEDTQAAIRKIMFDQKQKRMGLPTSDELTASDLLEKAKLAPGSPFLPGGPLADAPGGSNP
eukprot:TRINITY_DN19960_c0_g1_i1.p1 TRINITY_DN19960_c0_g1~~TRINITY_DN19960_c0_g1_i1.p1  ORF type:complete len:372 (-),score=65.71 TRINITY_DN19960_c0_g1_i1:17-1075(-)